jgi:hypothetical protein
VGAWRAVDRMRDCFPPFIVAGGDLTRPGQVALRSVLVILEIIFADTACDRAFDVRLLLRSEIQSDDRVQEPPYRMTSRFACLEI